MKKKFTEMTNMHDIIDLLSNLYPDFTPDFNICTYIGIPNICIAEITKNTDNNGYKTLCSLYVSEKYRNQGIGTKLIKYILKLYPKLGLHVFKTNKDAIKLYKSLGFHIIEDTEDGYCLEN